MDALTKTVLIVLLSAVAGGGLVWLLMTLAAQSQRIADLERKQSDGPAWAQGMKLDHRAQLVSIAALQEVAVRDLLDAMMRLDPQSVRRVVEEVAPHLFSGKVG